MPEANGENGLTLAHMTASLIDSADWPSSRKKLGPWKHKTSARSQYASMCLHCHHLVYVLYNKWCNPILRAPFDLFDKLIWVNSFKI